MNVADWVYEITKTDRRSHPHRLRLAQEAVILCRLGYDISELMMVCSSDLHFEILPKSCLNERGRI